MEKRLIKEVTTKTVEELISEGYSYGSALKAPKVVLMTGEAGSGKTHFVKGVAKALEIEAEIVSPTFSLRIEYDGKYRLNHIDMYRLTDLEEAFESGVFEGFDDANSVTFIEWGEEAKKVVTYPHGEIEVEYLSENERKIKIYEVE